MARALTFVEDQFRLITASESEHDQRGVYGSVPTWGDTARLVHDDCTATNSNACLNGVAVPVNGGVVRWPIRHGLASGHDDQRETNGSETPRPVVASMENDVRIRRVVFAVCAVGLFVGIVQGCATAPTVEDDDSGTTSLVDASTPDSNTTKPDSSKPDTSTRVDAADAAIVAPKPGDPFDPLAPKTGDACPPGVMENDVVSRRCGKCGSQIAICETGRKVGMYGACSDEKTTADACLPGERLVGECGLCGQQIKNCDTTCSYIEGACQNQVANGCPKNEVVYLEGLCAPDENVRRQVCSAACVKAPPEACAARPLDTLTVSQSAGTTLTGAFATTSNLKLPLLSGGCPASTGTTSSRYHYVRLTNSGADNVNVTVSNGIPAGSTSRPAVTFAVYNGDTIPTDRLACTGSVVTALPERVTVNIPAGASIILHTMLDAAAAPQAKLALEVKTNFVGVDPAATPDHILTIGANANDSVTQDVYFANTKVLAQLVSGACPARLNLAVSGYRYIRVVNPTAGDKTVDISGDKPLNSLVTTFPGPDAPLSADRLNCTSSVNDTCPGAANIATADSCVAGVNVPANGSIIVYFTPWSVGWFGAGTLRVTTKN